MSDPIHPRPPRAGRSVLVIGSAVILLVAASIAGGVVDLGLGGAPAVRIDAPTP